MDGAQLGYPPCLPAAGAALSQRPRRSRRRRRWPLDAHLVGRVRLPPRTFAGIPGDPIDPADLPAARLRLAAQREQTLALLDEYNRTIRSLRSLDSRFAALAASASTPILSAITLRFRLLRIADMLFRPAPGVRPRRLLVATGASIPPKPFLQFSSGSSISFMSLLPPGLLSAAAYPGR